MIDTQDIIVQINDIADAKSDRLNEEVDALSESVIAKGETNSENDMKDVVTALGRNILDAETKIATCKAKEKVWSDSRKAWERRCEAFKRFIGHQVNHFQLKSYETDEVKVSSRTTNVLNVNDEKLIARVMPLIDGIKKALPPYIKLTVAVDKVELKKTLTKDQSLLIDEPETVWYKENKSYTISTKKPAE